MTYWEMDAALVAEFRERVATGDAVLLVFHFSGAAVVRELDRLQQIIEELAARVAAQSELLGKRAERREM